MVELIITEKPSSAKKVAEALADGKLVQKKSKQSSYYELKHGKKDIIVTSAVGHLFGLVEKEKGHWTYPVFEIKWEESHKGNKELKYVKDYIDTISTLAKKADEFTVACDYDVEGEVIGFNVVRFVCKQKDANRMKFSTLTKPDLIKSYEEKMHHLDWGQAYAGETRHILDWFYGINLSRALTASVKAAGSFKIMSAGRVQGPALKLLVDREREIQDFKSEPYWLVGLWGDYQKNAIEAWHIKDRIFDKNEVKKIIDRVKDEKIAKIKEVKRTKREQSAPYPFDLTTLQSESYALFKITPKETLEVAQSLYLAGLTSYPRTSSQQLDPKLGLRKIVTDLAKQSVYTVLCNKLLEQKELKPNNGKKTDPAHPAIYPTGLVPGELKPRDQKLYDLIVKRFMATFASAAVRETMEVTLDVKSEEFVTKGTRTIEENWHVFYKPYLKLDEVTLPGMKEGETVNITEIKKVDKKTEPPHRFNQSSIIKELEKRNLGTKATRADILERLFQRGYIEGVQIKVSKLGMETVRLLEKHAPTIVDEQLTAHFEEEMDKIREGTEQQEKIIDEARKTLTAILTPFKKKEKEIGEEILKSVHETRDEQNYVGKCKACEGVLQLKMGKFGRFIACSKYPDCKVTFKVPAGAAIKGTSKLCEACTYPIISVIRKGRRPQEGCINPGCSTKIMLEAGVSVVGKVETPVVEGKGVKKGRAVKKSSGKASENVVPASPAEAKKCPKCTKDLILRRSFYGQFWGCSGYPNCKHIENIVVKKDDVNKVS